MAQPPVMRRLLPLGTVAGIVALVVSMMGGAGESVHLDDTRARDAGVRNAYKHADLRDTTQAAVSSAALPLESEALWNDLLARSGLDPQWLRAHGFIEGSDALKRLYRLLDGRVVAGGAVSAPTRIALGPQDSLRAASGESTPVLSRYERYVQAQLDASVLSSDSFIVRWRKADSGETMELTAQRLSPQTQGQAQGVPLWMHSSIDWPPGDYMVEVLAPDASLELLARGEFRIAAESEGVTPFAYAVPNAR